MSDIEKSNFPPRVSMLAVLSLIFGILSFVPLVGVVAIGLGHAARGAIRKSYRPLKG